MCTNFYLSMSFWIFGNGINERATAGFCLKILVNPRSFCFIEHGHVSQLTQLVTSHGAGR